MTNKTYRVEFLNPSTNSWLSADCDFEGFSEGFRTQKQAQEWIKATKEDECFANIKFMIIRGD